MPELRAESPLLSVLVPGQFGAQSAPGAPGVTIAERWPITLVGTFAQRGRGACVSAALQAALGAPMPDPNSATYGDSATTVMAIGPQRWLVVGPAGRDLHRHLRAAVPSSDAAIVDLSQGWAALRISGRRARDVLAKGCALDFHRRARPAGACVQTSTAGIAALVHVVESETVFDLYVGRSFAVWFYKWLCRAAAEYGFAVSGLTDP